MKSIYIAVLTVMPSFIFGQYTYDKLQVNFLNNETEAKTFTYENLRLYPIHAKEAFKKEFNDVGNYMPLKEAMKKGKVKITEKGNGASVNELWVENLSNDTIIIIPGEIVKGGKQDRIIDKDILLKPKSGKVSLPVFCVESGRWSYHAYTKPEFNTHYDMGAQSLRKTVEKKADQQEVWSKVDEINSKNKTETNTKTYTAVTNSADFDKKMNAYLNFFKAKFNSDNEVIGVVIATGDKVIGCDMFATNALFRQNFENLLHGYATEAIISGQKVNVSSNAVKSYMDKLLVDEKTQEQTLKEKGNKFEEKGKKLRVTSFD